MFLLLQSWMIFTYLFCALVSLDLVGYFYSSAHCFSRFGQESRCMHFVWRICWCGCWIPRWKQDSNRNYRSTSQFLFSVAFSEAAGNFSVVFVLTLNFCTEFLRSSEIILNHFLPCWQCMTLVDYYATLFFTQISSVQPDEFCEKMNLCQGKRILALPAAENSCDVCHQAVDEIIVRLKDPDTKLDIIEVLLKGCSAMENYAKKVRS